MMKFSILFFLLIISPILGEIDKNNKIFFKITGRLKYFDPSDHLYKPMFGAPISFFDLAITKFNQFQTNAFTDRNGEFVATAVMDKRICQPFLLLQYSITQGFGALGPFICIDSVIEEQRVEINYGGDRDTAFTNGIPSTNVGCIRHFWKGNIDSIEKRHFFMLFSFSIFFLISLPFAHSDYEFSNEQQIDIFIKLNDFWKWLGKEAYPKMRASKNHQISTPIPGGPKMVKFKEINWREIKLPSKESLRDDIFAGHFEDIFKEIKQYFKKLSNGQLDKEKKATEILGDLTIKFQKFRVEMSEWMEAKLEAEWRLAVWKGAASATKKEEDKKKGKQPMNEASSSSTNPEGEKEKIEAQFLPIKIKEKIYELNKQIWFQNYDPFFRDILKVENEKDRPEIWRIYERTLNSKRNEIKEKNLNKRVAEIVRKVKKGVDRKSFIEMTKEVENYLKEEGEKGHLGEKAKILENAGEFLKELGEWKKGKYPIVNKRKLAKLEADVGAIMDENAEEEEEKKKDEKEKKVMAPYMPPEKAYGSKLNPLWRMAKFGRNMVNWIEAEIGKKYENEAEKGDLKRLYYTLLTNRATAELANQMAAEFTWKAENERPKKRGERPSQRQEFVPLTEHLEEEEIQQVAAEGRRKKFAVENLAAIWHLVDFLKSYLAKLEEKVFKRKTIFDFVKEKLKGKKKQQKAPKEIMGQREQGVGAKYTIEEEEDNPLIISIKSLWRPTKDGVDHLQKVQTSDQYKMQFPNREFKEKFDFHLFEFALAQDLLPEKFIDRHKVEALGWNAQVRVVVDCMNLLAIFTRLKLLVANTGMDKSLRHFMAGKIGPQISRKLKAEIEQINGNAIPRTLAAFIYDKYAEHFEPNSTRSDHLQPTETTSIRSSLRSTGQNSPQISPNQSPLNAPPIYEGNEQTEEGDNESFAGFDQGEQVDEENDRQQTEIVLENPMHTEIVAQNPTSTEIVVYQNPTPNEPHNDTKEGERRETYSGPLDSEQIHMRSQK